MAIRFDAHRDEFHRDQQWHKPCRVATTANVTISTALNSGDTIDGITLADGDRVLVKNQSTGAQNGIYIVSASPSRAYDMLAGVQALGAFVHVTVGTANGGKLFKNTNTSLPTIDSTALTFAEYSPSAAITVEDEGTPLATGATTLDFVGAGVSASGTGVEKTITIPGGISGITVQDEGSPLSTLATTLDFVGAGVVATGTGATKTITISGGGGGGGSVDVQVFTSVGNGTWTKPTCSVVQVICIGGGGGGGAGRKGTGTRLGGGGGGGGGMTVKTFLATDLASTEKYTVGGGGAGANSQTTNGTSGASGTAGNPSFFGNSVAGTLGDAKCIAGGGGFGGGGTGASTPNGGNQGFGNVASTVAWSGGYASETTNSMSNDIEYFTGGGQSVSSAGARYGSLQFACGGGGGGGAVVTTTERAGGNGGVPVHRAGQTAVAGGAAHLPGSNGTAISSVDTLAPGGFGGSGGGGSNSGSPAPGGNGGLYGGGGGGGGAGTDSVVNSGAGGNGADGIVVVISW